MVAMCDRIMAEPRYIDITQLSSIKLGDIEQESYHLLSRPRFMKNWTSMSLPLSQEPSLPRLLGRSEISSNEGCDAKTEAQELQASALVQLPSVGSALHMEKQCQPCVFFAKKGSCTNESDCNFCHFPHTLAVKPGKKKREKMRAMAERTRAPCMPTCRRDMPCGSCSTRQTGMEIYGEDACLKFYS